MIGLFKKTTRHVPVGHIWRDNRAMSLVEFALSFPILMVMIAGGTECANYATTSMRVSQLALQVADNASRIGVGNSLAAKEIRESQINDILTGAQIQAGSLNLTGSYSELQKNGPAITKAKARVIISSLEIMNPLPVAPANPANKYWIRWQRCTGAMNNTIFPPQYGTAGQASGTNMPGMGPAGRQVTVPDGNIVIFVEVRYRYEPLFFNGFGTFPYQDMNAVASMIVRDDRNPVLVNDATQALCT
jgi:TadE-like protein